MPGTPFDLTFLFQRLSHRHQLTEADRREILSLSCKTQKFGRLDFLLREGEHADHAWIMISGFSVRHRVLRNGARQILSLHMRSDMVDFHSSFLGIADHNVQMLSDGEIALIPVETIKNLALDRPNVAIALWYETLLEGSIHREWMVNLGRRHAFARIAHIFCEFSLRIQHAGLGAQERFEFPMTQEELADAVGLTPIHVNRSIRGLEKEGFILRPSARTIVIADWQKLAAVSNFDSSYLHLNETERPNF